MSARDGSVCALMSKEGQGRLVDHPSLKAAYGRDTLTEGADQPSDVEIAPGILVGANPARWAGIVLPSNRSRTASPCVAGGRGGNDDTKDRLRLARAQRPLRYRWAARHQAGRPRLPRCLFRVGGVGTHGAGGRDEAVRRAEEMVGHWIDGTQAKEKTITNL